MANYVRLSFVMPKCLLRAKYLFRSLKLGKVTCVRKYLHTSYRIFKCTQTSVSKVVFTFVPVSAVIVRGTMEEGGIVAVNIV